MHFSRIDKHDASDRRYMLTSTIGKLLRALFNDSYHIALVRMGSKAVRDICRMQQFKITERGVMPEFDMLMVHIFLLIIEPCLNSVIIVDVTARSSSIAILPSVSVLLIYPSCFLSHF